MKIKYSALVSGVSGKLNGSVGATNRGGAYLRNKGVVTNPQTVSQQANRSLFGSISSQFRSLTPEQISAWNTAAANFPYTDKFGDVRYLSGSSLFLQLNKNLAQIGEPPLSDPPTKQSLPALVSGGLSVEITGGVVSAFVVNFTTNATTLVDYALEVRATPGLSPSVSYVKNLFRTIGFEDGTAAPDILFNTPADYIAVFGNIPVGVKVVAEVTLVSKVSGERSAPFLFETISIAG